MAVPGLLDGEDGSGSSLYFTMAKKADEQALRIRAAFEAKGCKVLHDSPTNQQFFVLPDEWYDKLAETYAMTAASPDKHHYRRVHQLGHEGRSRGAAYSRRRNAVITAS